MAAYLNAEEMLARALHQSTRRHFFADCGVGLGAVALWSLLAGDRPAVAMAETDRAGNDLTKGSKGRRCAVAIRSRRGPAIIRPGPGA